MFTRTSQPTTVDVRLRATRCTGIHSKDAHGIIHHTSTALVHTLKKKIFIDLLAAFPYPSFRIRIARESDSKPLKRPMRADVIYFRE